MTTKKDELRRSLLKLTARLYDVASEFNEGMLIELRELSEREGDRGVSMAIRGLLRLSGHEARASRNSQMHQQLPLPVASTGGAPNAGGTPEDRSLADFFSSKSIFPTSQSIVAALPFKFELRQKESRGRMVKRLIDRLNKMSSLERVDTIGFIQKKIADERGSGFVSNWSKLIRRL